jgi:hypothetical protein
MQHGKCELHGSKDNATHSIKLRSLKIKLGVNWTKPVPELQNATQRNVKKIKQVSQLLMEVEYY